VYFACIFLDSKLGSSEVHSITSRARSCTKTAVTSMQDGALRRFISDLVNFILEKGEP